MITTFEGPKGAGMTLAAVAMDIEQARVQALLGKKLRLVCSVPLTEPYTFLDVDGFRRELEDDNDV